MSLGGGGGGRQESAEAKRLYGVQADISKALFEQYEEFGTPLLKGISADAQRADSAAEIEGAAGRAGADVDLAYDKEEQRLARSLGRHGLSPSSGRYAGVRREIGLGRAASKAGAMTLGRRAAKDTAYRKRLNALGAAQGNVGAAQHGLSTAGAGYAGLAANAANAKAQQQAAWGQVIGGGLGLAAAFI